MPLEVAIVNPASNPASNTVPVVVSFSATPGVSIVGTVPVSGAVTISGTPTVMEVDPYGILEGDARQLTSGVYVVNSDPKIISLLQRLNDLLVLQLSHEGLDVPPWLTEEVEGVF